MTRRRILLCSPVMPAFDREGGSKRIYHFCRILREAGWAVVLIAHNGTDGIRYAKHLQRLGVEVYDGPQTMWARSSYLRDPSGLIKESDFDLAILFFWDIAEYYIPLIRKVSPRTRIVVDSVDLHFLRNARRIFRRSGASDGEVRLDGEYSDQFVRELNSYVAADGVLTVSEKEADLLADITGVGGLAYSVPLAEEGCTDVPDFGDRSGVLFVGNFRHPPNLEAVGFLFRQVLPCLDREFILEHNLQVIGNELDTALPQLGPVPRGVQLIGWVPDVVPYVTHARLSVVPLLHGAGTKTKLVQTLMLNTPAVSTTVGVEGLGLEHGKHVLIADDAETFANSITKLATDAALWRTLAEAGRTLVESEHSLPAVATRLMIVLDTILRRSKGRPGDVGAASFG